MAQGYHNLEVTAGAFWKPLPLTVTYEATIPLIYKANWHDDTSVGETRSKNQCSYEDNQHVKGMFIDKGHERITDVIHGRVRCINKQLEPRLTRKFLDL
ncbi:hypothetical protein JTB14_033057 [Gonioctena quinquepunctata]|nr:hypothetical protein JTB14_033057 [Gonioctena quinquepunctata]